MLIVDCCSFDGMLIVDISWLKTRWYVDCWVKMVGMLIEDAGYSLLQKQCLLRKRRPPTPRFSTASRRPIWASAIGHHIRPTRPSAPMFKLERERSGKCIQEFDLSKMRYSLWISGWNAFDLALPKRPLAGRMHSRIWLIENASNVSFEFRVETHSN